MPLSPRHLCRCLVVAWLAVRADALQPSTSALRLKRPSGAHTPLLRMMVGGGGGGGKRIPILDDVLDYLTNMGGYNGFTEEELKMGGDSLDRVDMDEFGRELETDDTVTTVFIIVFLFVPVIVGAIAFQLGIAEIPRFVKVAT